MNRRDLFLTSAAFLALGPLTARAETAAPARLKPEFFTRDPVMSPPQLSPDGTHLAWIDGNQVVVFNLTDDTQKTLNGGENRLGAVQWVGNDYMVVYLKEDKVPRSTTDIRTVSYSPIVLTRDAKVVRPLFQRGTQAMTYSDLLPIVCFLDEPSPGLVALDPLDSGHTIRIDVVSGKRLHGDLLLSGIDHLFDRQGRERVAVDIIDGKVSYGMTALTVRIRPQAGAPSFILSLPKQDKIDYVDYQFSEFENAFYWSEFDYTKGICSIFRYDISTREKSLYRSGPDKDMSLTFDKFGRIVGVTTMSDRVHTEWTDPYHLKMVGAVQKLYPDAFVDIVDMTADGAHIVFLISAPEAPDSYYYYSAKTKELVRIGGNYPELDDQTLAPMTYVTYKARDGLDIPAYVTKRKDTPAKAPLIVLAHGGPRARDIYGFDYEAQYFASKGYVVLQPQYRGSGGFSDAFERAGNLHLDQMATDLEDGVRFLSAKGDIDPRRVCVAGWSWGGYLAEAALAFTPDTYTCGIAGAGVSDLFASLDDDNDVAWGGYGIAFWQGVIGRPIRDSAKIHATSPIEHVSAIRAPLLLIHGDSDDNVKVRHSRKMNEAMKKAGKDVTYLEVKFMRHGPNDAAQRLMVLNAMDAFVTKAFGNAG